MITFVTGDLLSDNAQALVNTVNTVGVMGKGIALQFKEQYPENYILYKKACKEGKIAIGQIFITDISNLSGRKLIVNFPTKTTWRKPSEYVYIEKGLLDLKNKIQELKIQSIAIPPLGSHNGGLDWFRVKEMIIGSLNDVDCDIRIYEPTAAIVDRLKSERVRLTPARAMLLDVLCDVVAYGEFISVFAAEKIVYFLQRFGAQNDFNIKFERGYYGPYSGGKIAHVLYYLNGSYLKGMAGMQTKPFDEIWLLDETPQYIKEYLNHSENRKYKEIADRTKTFLRGFYSNYSLELLSTVDYILYLEKFETNIYKLNLDEQYTVINNIISSWNPRKQCLFNGSKFLPIILKHLRQSLNVQPHQLM